MYIKKFNLFRINEGRYDKLSNEVSSDIFEKWKSDFDKGLTKSTFKSSYANNDIEMDIKAILVAQPGIKKVNIDGGVYSESSYLEIDFEVDTELLPQLWEEVSMSLKDVVRHEIEHLTHGEGYNANLGKLMRSDKGIRDMVAVGLVPRSAYLKLKKEVDANLQGLYFRAKKERKPFVEVINNYLNTQDITEDEKQKVLDVWRKRVPALNLPPF